MKIFELYVSAKDKNDDINEDGRKTLNPFKSIFLNKFNPFFYGTEFKNFLKFFFIGMSLFQSSRKQKRDLKKIQAETYNNYNTFISSGYAEAKVSAVN